MADIEALCREAWSAVKGDLRPEFDALEESYRQRLIDKAKVVEADKRVLDDGGSIFQEFEQVVLELLIPERFHQPNPEPKELPAEVKEELAAEAEPEDVKPLLELKGPLPKDFPAFEKLHDAGVNTYGQLAKIEELTSIIGIGPAAAKLITKRLRADTRALNK